MVLNCHMSRSLNWFQTLSLPVLQYIMPKSTVSDLFSALFLVRSQLSDTQVPIVFQFRT